MTEQAEETFVLWDEDTMNMVGSYPTAEEAWRVRKRLIDANASHPEWADDLIVIHHDEKGNATKLSE